MKYLIKSIITLIFFSAMVITANAQGKTKAKKVATSEFTVNGVCGMCKDRIENAALIKGVKLAEWDKEAQTIKVIYKTKKVTEEQIHQALANAGHDTEKIKATDEAYSKLHKCCSYRDMEVH